MKAVRKSAFAAVIVALVFSAGAARAAGILDQVPADAFVVIKVSNLEQTSGKIAKWAEQLGLAQAVPEFADPLKAVEEQMNITKGLDRTGEMAFVFVNPQIAGGDADQALLVLAPTKDYKAFLANFQVKGGAGGISSFVDEDSDQEIFVANWGAFAAMSPSKAVLGKKPGGFKLSAMAGREGNEKDVLVYANIPALRSTLLPALEKAREQMQKGFDQNLGPAARAEAGAAAEAIPAAQQEKTPEEMEEEAEEADGAPGAAGGGGFGAGNIDPEVAKRFMPVAKAALNGYLNIGKQFLEDSEGAMIGISLTDAGLNTTIAADFKQGSYIGNLASQTKNTKENLLAGLPQRKYFAFGGVSFSKEPLTRLVTDLIDPVGKELAQVEGGKDLATALDAAKRSSGAVESMSFGYTVPTGALGADSIIQQVAVVRGDAKTIGESQKQMLQGVGKLFAGLPQDAGAMSFEYEPGTKTVDGVKLDTYRYNLAMDENNPQAAQAQQMMAFMYGPNGMGGTTGAIDAKTYIVVNGGTDKLLKDSVAAARGGKDPLSGLPGVTAVSKQLPAERFAVEYVDLAQIVTSGVKYAQGFGAPVKLQLPADLPPIGASAATQGTAIRIDVHVPTTLIQSLVAAGMQTYMEFQGGGGDGAGEPEGL